MSHNKIKNEIIEKNLVCSKPFEYIEIDSDGKVFSCCPDYTKGFYLANIFDASFEDIWLGENFNKHRKDVLDGLYTNCCLDFCYNLEKLVFKNKQEYLNKKVNNPKYVTISIDKTCNARCIFCREKPFIPDKEKENKLIGMIDNFFIPLLENAESIHIEGAGELFVSKFDRLLIQKAAKKYPKLRFELLTNGFLCNEKNLKDLGIYDRLSLVTVSMHATTKNTYEKIVKGINFDRVVENIKFLSKMKQENKLQTFLLTFVITSLNYKELPDFIEFAYSVNAIPQIWVVRDYSSYDVDSISSEKIQELNVLDKLHPEHENFLKILQNPVFKKYEIISDFLFEFNEEMSSFYDNENRW